MVFALSSGEEGVQPEGLFVPCLPSSGWASPRLQQSIWCTTLLHSGWGYALCSTAIKVHSYLTPWQFGFQQTPSWLCKLCIWAEYYWLVHRKDTHSHESFRKIWITMNISGCQNLSHRTVFHQLLWVASSTKTEKRLATLVSFLKWLQIFTGGH